jgi:hypothetical protein
VEEIAMMDRAPEVFAWGRDARGIRARGRENLSRNLSVVSIHDVSGVEREQRAGLKPAPTHEKMKVEAMAAVRRRGQ